jgi:hypothetical protein
MGGRPADCDRRGHGMADLAERVAELKQRMVELRGFL